MSKKKYEVLHPGAWLATKDGERELKVGEVVEFDDAPDFLAGKAREVATAPTDEVTPALEKLTADNADMKAQLLAAAEQVKKLTDENAALTEQVQKLAAGGKTK